MSESPTQCQRACQTSVSHVAYLYCQTYTEISAKIDVVRSLGES
jgi:hypothetical protein